MSDTPISDSTPHNVADLAMKCRMLERQLKETDRLAAVRLDYIKQLERELTAAYDRIKQLEEENDAMRADLLLWHEHEQEVKP